jgi:predicted amidohydrolase YtcJ
VIGGERMRHRVEWYTALPNRSSPAASSMRGPGRGGRPSAAAATAVAGTWVRVIGWSETGARQLDRHRLDILTGQIPVRVQHRSGAMWVLNSAAIRLAGVGAGDLPGIERDAGGQPTGRLYRMDGWLRDRLAALPGARPAASFAGGLAGFAAEAAARGITGLTDATPDRDDDEVAEFAQLSAADVIRQRLVLVAPPGVRDPGPGRIALGPHNLILDDAALPGPGELAAMISRAHEAGSPVALHCVTAEQLLVSIAALTEAGSQGDRIEHAGIVPPGCAAQLTRLSVAVVTNPGFIADRGDDYRRDVEPAERDWLYPCASLISAGVAVAAGTDVPFAPSDPWHCIAAAATRRPGTAGSWAPPNGCRPDARWGCSWPTPGMCGVSGPSPPASPATCACWASRCAQRWPRHLRLRC